MDEWKKDPYIGRIVQTPTGAFVVGEGSELVALEGTQPGQPVFRWLEPLELKAGEIANLSTDVTTTVGNAFVNQTTLVYAMGKKMPFVVGKFNVGKVESEILARLQDSPELGTDIAQDNADPLTAPIYVHEYLSFVDAMQHLTVYSQLAVWAATEKTMTAPPGVKEYREQLLEEYKDRLHDPEIIALIDKKLVEFDSQYLKGDPGENFLLSAKSRQVVRKKLFLMHGAEQGIEGAVSMELIDNSLSEGWSIDKFPLLNDSLRSGSFNRGAETQLGGEATKWLFRASSNVVVTVDDCGSTMGMMMNVKDDNVEKLVGFSIITQSGPKFIATKEEAGAYLGKTLMRRSPMFCKLDKTDYCKTCVGIKLAENPTAVSLAVAAYGSTFLSLFMKAMHGKVLAVEKMDLQQALT